MRTCYEYRLLKGCTEVKGSYPTLSALELLKFHTEEAREETETHLGASWCEVDISSF